MSASYRKDRKGPNLVEVGVLLPMPLGMGFYFGIRKKN
jgi:hypothetical protein